MVRSTLSGVRGPPEPSKYTAGSTGSPGASNVIKAGMEAKILQPESLVLLDMKLPLHLESEHQEMKITLRLYPHETKDTWRRVTAILVGRIKRKEN